MTDPACRSCATPGLPDPEGLVVRRGRHAYAALHPRPDAPGHLVVVPRRHVLDYRRTSAEEAAEIGDLTRQAMSTLRVTSGAAGFNIGINQGVVASEGHLTQHVVPRWPGDHNFMPVIGRTRTLPELLPDTRAQLVERWADGAPGR